MNAHDVIVVGAGPAGCRSSRLLAEWGFRVLLLEKEKLPRYKACAGGLTLKAQAETGLELDEVVERWVYGSRCRLDESHQVDVMNHEQPAVAMVMRDRLDAALAEAAVRSGVELEEGAKVLGVEEHPDRVVARTAGHAYTASYLIGADGAAGAVSRSLGLLVKTHRNPAVEGELYPPGGAMDPLFERLAYYDFGIIPGGYGWVFPKKKHYSVGVCSTYPGVRDVMPRFQAFIKAHPFLEACRPQRVKGWLLPLGTTGGRIASGRSLLAGDAAGCTDPFTGEGIAFALKSGALAAGTLKNALSSGGPSALDAYQAAMDRDIYSELRLGRWFARIFYGLPRLTFKVLIKDQRVVNHFFELMAGRETYRDMLRLFRKNWWRLRLH